VAESLVCWKCGGPLDALPVPFARLAECPACEAELHVCRMCVFHDPRVADQCREPVADPPADKEHANFCGYFQPRPDAYRPADRAAAQRARSELDALFGLPPGSSEGAAGPTRGEGPADPAREELERLFAVGGKEGR
jgi:hypothetical protein